MFGKKKKLNGFHPKTRTIAEINKDYNEHAVQIGHKTRIILGLQDEVDQHLARLAAINAEALRTPAEPPKAPEAANSEAPKA